jgi:hypothetical protein
VVMMVIVITVRSALVLAPTITCITCITCIICHAASEASTLDAGIAAQDNMHVRINACTHPMTRGKLTQFLRDN